MTVPARLTCTAAAVSLIFGMLSWLALLIVGAIAINVAEKSVAVSTVLNIVFWLVLPIIGAIVAIIAGRKARNKIKGSNGTLDGDSMATVGLVLGWVLLVGVVLMVLLYFVRTMIFVASLPPAH